MLSSIQTQRMGNASGKRENQSEVRMDTGELVIVITLAIGFSAIVIAMFALMWQSRRDTRSLAEDIRDLRNDLRRIGERVSEAELEQARIEARNQFLAEAVSRQENLHQVHAD